MPVGETQRVKRLFSFLPLNEIRLRTYMQTLFLLPFPVLINSSALWPCAGNQVLVSDGPACARCDCFASSVNCHLSLLSRTVVCKIVFSQSFLSGLLCVRPLLTPRYDLAFCHKEPLMTTSVLFHMFHRNGCLLSLY